MKTVRCHAFVSADDLIINAVVRYNPVTGLLISAEPFDCEIHSTSDFDGIAVAGHTLFTDAEIINHIDRRRFSESLADLRRILQRSDAVRLVRI